MKKGPSRAGICYKKYYMIVRERKVAVFVAGRVVAGEQGLADAESIVWYYCTKEKWTLFLWAVSRSSLTTTIDLLRQQQLFFLSLSLSLSLSVSCIFIFIFH